MPNDKIAAVGANIVEKAAMIWNVADMLRGHIEHKNGGPPGVQPRSYGPSQRSSVCFCITGAQKGRDAQNIPA